MEQSSPPSGPWAGPYAAFSALLLYVVYHGRQEMEVIAGAPITFLIAVAVGWFIVGGYFRIRHGRRLDEIPILHRDVEAHKNEIGRLNERLKTKDEELAKLKETAKALTEQKGSRAGESTKNALPSLTLSAQKDLIAVLREYGGKRARVQVQLATRAVTPLARWIASVFQAAEWETEYSGFPLEPHVPAYFRGIDVRGANPQLVEPVVEALKAAGLPGVQSTSEPAVAKDHQKWDRLQNSIRIIVGHQE